MQLGAVGVVTDGAVRDTPALQRMGIPVYHRASHGATYRRLHMPVEQQVPIACAGVAVVPGDVIVGDEEGVVVVPEALADEIAAEAERQELEEEWGMQRVAAGESTDGAFPITPPAAPSSRRGAGRSATGSWRMTRRSYDIGSMRHSNPIPAVTRIGPLVVSSVVASATGHDQVPDTIEAQIANLFRHVDEMLRTRRVPSGVTSPR